jgi:hypothetical protein
MGHSHPVSQVSVDGCNLTKFMSSHMQTTHTRLSL